MRNDYFDSEEFKNILNKYEASEKQGISCYFDAEDFVDIADHFLLSERAEDALRAIKKGIAIHPDDDGLKETHSACLIFMTRYKEARKVLNTVTDQSDSNVIYQRAQLAYAIDNDIETAEELFTEWIELEEKNLKYEAEEDRDFRHRDAYLHVITSLIELRGDDYEDEIVKRWVEEYYARFAPLGGNEADLILADLVRNEAMTDMVEKVYSSLLEYDPYINQGWVVLSTAQVVNGHYHEALESAEFALAIAPDNIDVTLNKAHAYYSLGMRDKAIVCFEKYLSKIDDANQYLPYTICLISVDRIEEAKKYIRLAENYVMQHSDEIEYYASANYELAEAYLSLDDLDRSLDAICRSLEIYPHDLQFLLLDGSLHLIRQEFEECIESFTDYINYSEDKVLATLVISHRFTLEGQTRISLHMIDTISEIQEESPSYRLVSAYKAIAHAYNGDIEDFLANLKIACKECPSVVSNLFWDLIPQNVSPEDFYDYVINNPESLLSKDR